MIIVESLCLTTYVQLNFMLSCSFIVEHRLSCKLGTRKSQDLSRSQVSYLVYPRSHHTGSFISDHVLLQLLMQTLSNILILTVLVNLFLSLSFIKYAHDFTENVLVNPEEHRSRFKNATIYTHIVT